MVKEGLRRTGFGRRWRPALPLHTWGDMLYHRTVKLSQSIRFCTSADGTRIAIASCGEGPVILRAAHWLSHVDYDLESPVWRPWLQALSARNRFVRYDPRGCGLSDRHVADLSRRRVARGPGGGGRVDRGAALRPSRPFAGRRARHRLCPEASRAGIASGALERLRPGRAGARADRCGAAGGRDAGQFHPHRLGARQSGVLPVLHQPLHSGRHAGAASLVGRSGAGDGKRRRRRATALADAGDRRAGPCGAGCASRP